MNDGLNVKKHLFKKYEWISVMPLKCQLTRGKCFSIPAKKKTVDAINHKDSLKLLFICQVIYMFQDDIRVYFNKNVLVS